MARWSEDQFTRWHSNVDYDEDALSAPEGVFTTPYVFEQYSWKSPVDASIAKVANNWIFVYRHTADTLALAKAKALADSIVKLQNPETGMIPTVPRPDKEYDVSDNWANCTYTSIRTLMMMDSILGE